jgi:hypothetical protein
MLSMPEDSWRLGLWLMVGLVVYFLCAWRHGRLGAGEGKWCAGGGLGLLGKSRYRPSGSEMQL